MTTRLFEAAFESRPRDARNVSTFDTTKQLLTIAVEFAAGSRFTYLGVTGEHPAYETQVKRLRHLNLFQHECCHEVLVP